MHGLKNPKPEANFRIYPEPKGFFFRVKVFRSEGDMHSYLRRIHPTLGCGKPHDKVQAYCGTFGKAEGSCIGELTFHHHTCTDRIVAHECLHATFSWAIWIKLKPQRFTAWNHEDHERVALGLDNLVSQFWRQYSRRYPRSECWGFPKS